MAETLELAALALPGDTALESLPATVRQFVANCWPGMSRGQLRRSRASPRAAAIVARRSFVWGERAGRGWLCLALTLTAGAQVVSLITHLRRVAQRRASAGSRKADHHGAATRARSAPCVAVLGGEHGASAHRVE